MRLLLISIGAVFFTLVILLMARFYGLSQPYQPYDHEFLKAAKPWQVVKVLSAPEAQDVLNHNKDVIFWLDLSKTQDGHFLILNPERKINLTPELLKENFRSSRTYDYDLKTLRLFYDKEPLLENFFTEFPGSRFILNVLDNAPEVHLALISEIKKQNAGNRVLIQSDIDLVLSSIKEMEPLWLFGTSLSDLMKMNTFDSIGLAPSSPFHGDVFISPMKVMNRPAFTESVLNEIRRRLKPVVLGPLKNEQEIIDARSLKPDGYIYENSRLFLKELDQHPAQ